MKVSYLGVSTLARYALLINPKLKTNNEYLEILNRIGIIVSWPNYWNKGSIEFSVTATDEQASLILLSIENSKLIPYGYN
jgi:hypothetical protein